MTVDAAHADPPAGRPLTSRERLEVWLMFAGVGIVLLGLAVPFARMLFSDGAWLALTPCTLVTGLGPHLSGGSPGVCAAPFSEVPVLGWLGNLHNRNLVAWGVALFMVGMLSSGRVSSPDQAAA